MPLSACSVGTLKTSTGVVGFGHLLVRALALHGVIPTPRGGAATWGYPLGRGNLS